MPTSRELLPVFFAPNAYLLSVWNGFDLAILIALLIGSIGNVVFIGGLSRASRALKAARALRLITLSKQLRETFYSILVAGAGKILDASVLVILYLIPYAVWGLVRTPSYSPLVARLQAHSTSAVRTSSEAGSSAATTETSRS